MVDICNLFDNMSISCDLISIIKEQNITSITDQNKVFLILDEYEYDIYKLKKWIYKQNIRIQQEHKLLYYVTMLCHNSMIYIYGVNKPIDAIDCVWNIEDDRVAKYYFR